VNFLLKYFFCCGRPYCTDPYSPYDSIQSIRIWHGNRGISGMDFEVDFCFLFVVFVPYGTVRTADYGHGKRGRRRPYSGTVLARNPLHPLNTNMFFHFSPSNTYMSSFRQLYCGISNPRSLHFKSYVLLQMILHVVLYFSSCAMISCMGFLLRSGVMVSNLVMKVINIGYELITLLTINTLLFCLVYHGGHNCP
jgi:hypothetical protein